MDKFEQHIKRMKGLRDVYEVGTGQHNILSMLIKECEVSCQTAVSYKPLTLSRIEEIVDETKDLTPKEQTSVAYSMPMIACGLYVLKMKSKYGISIAI